MSRKSKKTTPIVPFVIFGVVLIAALILVIVSLSQRGSINESTQLLSEPKTETIINIDAPAPQEIIIETRGEGLTDYGDTPYDLAYDERTKDFRLICASPCPISKTVLDQEFTSIAHSIQVMRGVTQSDIDSSLLPITVHASEDLDCPLIDGAAAYSSQTWNDGRIRGKLCFFYDKINYDRSKFPYSTSIHEVMHQFQINKLPYRRQEGGSILWEGLAEMMESIFLRTNDKLSYCANNGQWWLNYFETLDDEYTTEAHTAGRALFIDLCLTHGFDYDDLPALFDKLETGNVNTEQEFVNAISQVVGRDTSSTFAKYGVYG